MSGNLMLQCATKLSKQDMKNVKGGISSKEYCDTLIAIMLEPENHANGNIDQGACEGASQGARDAGCSFTISC